MKKLLFLVSLLLLTGGVRAQSRGENYDESKVPVYTLPDPLICENGQRVTSVRQWETTRRPELLNMFSSQMYGITPKEDIPVEYQIVSEKKNAFQGKASCKQIRFCFKKNGKEIEAMLILYTPNAIKGKVPVFLSYNFMGNQSIDADEDILVSPGLKFVKSPDDKSMERGYQQSRWPIEMILDAGFGLATMCYHDIYPDDNALKDKSVLALFDDYEQTNGRPDAWQALGGWAWGLSRIMDCLEKDDRVNEKQVVVMGHSRQGKATLWSGAQDKRFAIVISNNSGCGGAALSKRRYGETFRIMTNSFPHWLCKTAEQYADNEDMLPFDQHELIALIAPRPVYIASAQEDRWADPKGEFLSGVHAASVYELYGLKGLGVTEMPAVNQPIMNNIGYHIRPGKHDVMDIDWQNYIRFAQKHLAELN
ncbi:acetylxylan esterase [Massilibacteroides sp.]|uniref:glucuronyl esterase domain-containing protein n=1 Tax=Massilibacteroides sp. TaxID=2034766 RepID=UPI002605B7F1|nr:acetylxylan esterase [Massilibacteroides sp.]MDD4515140.1 acetylxylan esterase [Massilibacteroides sp.]